MKKNPYPGLFIDIEGIDGAGATIHTALLRNRVSKDKRLVYVSKEPTNNIIGGLIRGALEGLWKTDEPELLQLLFAADRAQHLEIAIIPQLERGAVAITDRYFWSSMAYGHVSGLFNFAAQINSRFFAPDISIVLKVSPKICVERMKADRFSFELYEEEGKLKKAWEGYERVVKKWGDLVQVVDGERPTGKVAEDIYSSVKKHPKYKSGARNAG